MNTLSRKTLAVVVILIVVGAVLAGYYAYTKLAPSGPSEIHLGVLAPVTGTSAANGKHMVDGATLAVNEINAAGGILGKKVVLYIEDHADSPDRGVAGARKLVYEDKVIAITGVYLTGVALALSPLISETKVILITTTASSVDITKQVLMDYNRYKYIFMNTGNTTQDALGTLQYLRLALPAGSNRTWVMVGEDLKWTQDTMDVLVPMAAKEGFTFLGPQYRVPLGTNDFSPIISKIKTQQPGAVLHLSGTTNSVVFVKQWKSDPVTRKIPLETGSSGMIESPDSVRAVEQTNPGALDYTFVHAHAWPSPRIPASTAYADNFQKAFGYPADGIDMKTYESVYLIKAAIEKTKSLETDALVSALEQMDYQGITGRIRFDKSHSLVFGNDYWTGVLVQWGPGLKANIIWPPYLQTVTQPTLPIPG